MRFVELKNKIGCTAKVLTNCLKELEEDGLVVREEYEGLPPKVEYYLTDIGYTLRPVIDSMQKWGKEYKRLRKLMERTGCSLKNQENAEQEKIKDAEDFGQATFKILNLQGYNTFENINLCSTKDELYKLKQAFKQAKYPPEFFKILSNIIDAREAEL